MANLNCVHLIGRLTRDPEAIQSKTGGAKFGFAVNNRKFDQQTQKWEDEPVYLDCEIWNRGENKQADRVLQTLTRGQQVFLEGHLKYEQWEDKNGGGKRNKITIVVDGFQYLDARLQPGEQTVRQAPGEVKVPTRKPAMTDDEYADRRESRNASQDDDVIPF